MKRFKIILIKAQRNGATYSNYIHNYKWKEIFQLIFQQIQLIQAHKKYEPKIQSLVSFGI